MFLLYRMCKALMPSDDDTMSDDVIWETLPVSLSPSYVFCLPSCL